MENLLKNVPAAVTGNFGGILACITVGGTEHAHQYIIDGVAILILDFSIMQGIGLGFFQGFAVGRLEDFVGEGNGVGATESDNSDSTAGWGCQGADTFFLILHLFVSFF